MARPRLRPLGAEAAASLAAGGQDPASEPTTLLPEGSRLRAPPSASSHHPRCYQRARRAFFPVARNVNTVFCALPPKKRIRGG